MNVASTQVKSRLGDGTSILGRVALQIEHKVAWTLVLASRHLVDGRGDHTWYLGTVAFFRRVRVNVERLVDVV